MAMVHFSMGHTVNSVPSYMSALQKLYDGAALGPLPRGPSFALVLRGLKRLLATSDQVVQTRAITMQHLHAMVQSLDIKDPESVCFACHLIIAFFLCLRTEDHVNGRLKWGAVYPQPGGDVLFWLPPGKIHRTYRLVGITGRDDELDLQPWLQRLRAFVPASSLQESSPLFMSFTVSSLGEQYFCPLTTGQFTGRFKRCVREVLGFDPELFSGYSLRRGGVTALVSSTCPVPVIKRHVGWAPGSQAIDAYYDHTAVEQLRIPSAALKNM